MLRLLRELNRTDEVRLVCLRDGPLAEDARSLGIPCTAAEGGFFRGLRAVRQELAQSGAAIVHCHGSRANLTGALLKGQTKARFVSTIHSDHRLDYLRRPPARAVYGTLNSLSLRRMDALICVSDAVKELYRSRGFHADRLYAVYNGTDTEKMPVSVNRTEWFARYGVPLPEGAIVVGTAARFDAVKDLPTLLRGFADAAKTRPALRLALAGAGAEEASLRALAEALGVSQSVFFLGWVEDMDGFFASLDIHALTSLFETFPFVLTDGARYALPTVATAVGGIPALIEDGQTGLLIEPGDSPALARALGTLADDPALARTLGEALREKTLRDYSLSAMAEAQRDCYRAVGAKRVTVLGACGQGNLGDEVMAESILRDIREIDARSCVTVLSRSPKETAARFGVSSQSSLSLPVAARLLRQTDVFLLGGGNLLQDYTSRRSLWLYCAWLKRAKAARCRVVLYAAGTGPLSERGWKRAAEAVETCADAVLLREEESRDALRAHGVQTPELLVGTDAALTTEPGDADLAAWGLTGNTNYLAIVLRAWRGRERSAASAARALTELAETHDMTPLFLTLCREDAALTQRAASAVGAKALDISSSDGASAAALLGGMAFVASMRLHAVVLAFRAGAPCIGLDGDGRIAAFCRCRALPCVSLGEDIRTAADAALRDRPNDAERRACLDKALKLTEIGKTLLTREIGNHG